MKKTSEQSESVNIPYWYDKKPNAELPKVYHKGNRINMTLSGDGHIFFETQQIIELLKDSDFQIFYTNHLQTVNTALCEMVYRFMVADNKSETVNTKPTQFIHDAICKHGKMNHFTNSFFHKNKNEKTGMYTIRKPMGDNLDCFSQSFLQLLNDIKQSNDTSDFFMVHLNYNYCLPIYDLGDLVRLIQSCATIRDYCQHPSDKKINNGDFFQDFFQSIFLLGMIMPPEIMHTIMAKLSAVHKHIDYKKQSGKKDISKFTHQSPLADDLKSLQRYWSTQQRNHNHYFHGVMKSKETRRAQAEKYVVKSDDKNNTVNRLAREATQKFHKQTEYWQSRHRQYCHQSTCDYNVLNFQQRYNFGGQKLKTLMTTAGYKPSEVIGNTQKPLFKDEIWALYLMHYKISQVLLESYTNLSAWLKQALFNAKGDTEKNKGDTEKNKGNIFAIAKALWRGDIILSKKERGKSCLGRFQSIRTNIVHNRVFYHDIRNNSYLFESCFRSLEICIQLAKKNKTPNVEQLYDIRATLYQSLYNILKSQDYAIDTRDGSQVRCVMKHGTKQWRYMKKSRPDAPLESQPFTPKIPRTKNRNRWSSVAQGNFVPHDEHCYINQRRFMRKLCKKWQKALTNSIAQDNKQDCQINTSWDSIPPLTHQYARQNTKIRKSNNDEKL